MSIFDVRYSSTNNFTHAQTLSRMSSLSGHMIIGRINIECFPEWKKIKQRRITFVLGYLRMILWKIPTAIYLYGFLNQSSGLILGNIISIKTTVCVPLNFPFIMIFGVILDCPVQYSRCSKITLFQKYKNAIQEIPFICLSFDKLLEKVILGECGRSCVRVPVGSNQLL